MVRHFGVFEFHKEVTEEEIKECFAVMQEMVGQIPGLISMEHGPYNGNEGLNDTFTHGFLMNFDSEESRDKYLPHPVHEHAKSVVVPRLKRVIVFDIAV
jgi:hypothetical protein